MSLRSSALPPAEAPATPGKQAASTLRYSGLDFKRINLRCLRTTEGDDRNEITNAAS